jgi:hypothetical protein
VLKWYTTVLIGRRSYWIGDCSIHQCQRQLQLKDPFSFFQNVSTTALRWNIGAANVPRNANRSL